MSTLVLSDLHLGSRLRHDALTHPEPMHQLLEALEGVERLVLLGDVVELLEARGVRAMDVPERILRLIGGTLGLGREVIFVPGNHDRALIAAGSGESAPGSLLRAAFLLTRPRSWPASRPGLRPRASACTSRASGSPPECGRRTDTTSIGTCCLRPRTA